MYIIRNEEEEDQENFKGKLGKIKSGYPKHKSEKHAYTIKNVKNLYDSRQKNYWFT